MAQAFTLVIDSTGDPEHVIAHGYPTEIEVAEQLLAGTAAYTIKTLPDGDLVQIAAGVPYVFKAPKGGNFTPNQKVAEIASVGAAMTFVQKENG